MRRIAKISVFCFFAWSVLTSRPASAEKKLLELPDGTTVQITLPQGWVASWKVAGGVGTAEISGEPGTDALVLITILPTLPPDSSVKDAPSLRQMVEAQGQQQLPTALQEKLTITELHLSEGAGFVYHLTDRNPEKGPGDYREVHQGALLSGGRLLTVTALSHPNDARFVASALELLASIRVLRKEAAEPAPPANG